MSKIIVGSTKVSILDFKIENNLCDGKIYVTPQFTFIGAGVTTVLGARVQILKDGIEVKSYLVGYDFTNPFTASYAYTIPTINGGYDYGNYEVEVTLVEDNTISHVLSKPYNLCKPNKVGNKTNRVLGAHFVESCSQGKVFVTLNQPAVYKSLVQESSVIDVDVEFPFGNLPKQTHTTSNIVVQLFEGEYSLKGDLCVTYNGGDSVYYRLPYKVNISKSVKCQIDYCCVFTKMSAIYNELQSCGAEDKEKGGAILGKSTMLLSIIEKGLSCGESVSDYIKDLEETLGLECLCGLDEGTPIINGTPSQNVTIQGCNVSKTVVGLNDVYTIENYTFIVEAHPTQDFFTVSSPQLTGCQMKQEVSFDLSKLYRAVIDRVDIEADYARFTTYWKKGLTISPENLACLGITQAEFDAMDGSQYENLLISKLCVAYNGGNCDAVISNLLIEKQANHALLTWDANASVKSVRIYRDNDFVDSVLMPLEQYLVNNGADGIVHTYKVIAFCQNDIAGNELTITEAVYPCAFIAPPTLNASFSTATKTCPFNLAAHIDAAPVGFTNVYFTSNNTTGTPIADPTTLSTGTYWVFRKDNLSGCFSTGISAELNCISNSLCDAPPTVKAENVVGGVLVHFPSALNPPPSYLVRRKLASATDVPANYTTIGAPSWSAINGRWEIIDTTSTVDTLYTYAAVSMCAGGEEKATVEHDTINCGVVSLTRNGANIDYSLVPNGGQVTAISVDLYDNTGLTVVGGFSHTAPFANPITGTLAGIAVGDYKVRRTVFIGAYQKSCPFVDVTV